MKRIMASKYVKLLLIIYCLFSCLTIFAQSAPTQIDCHYLFINENSTVATQNETAPQPHLLNFRELEKNSRAFIHYIDDPVLTFRNFGQEVKNLIATLFIKVISPKIKIFTSHYRITSKYVNTFGQLTASDTFKKIVLLSIDFTIKHYKMRRPLWVDDFLNKIRQEAIDISHRCEYIVASLERNETKDNIIGTLKIVSILPDSPNLHDHRLPAEEFLGYEFPLNAQRKFELANFAISREFNKEAFTELILQLILHAIRVSQEPGHVKDQMIYFTYADPTNVRMYKQLGLEVISLPQKVDNTGLVWTPMGISAEGVMQIFKKIKLSRKITWDEKSDNIIDSSYVIENIYNFFVVNKKEFLPDSLYGAFYDVNF